MWLCICPAPSGVRQASESHLTLPYCPWGEGDCHGSSVMEALCASVLCSRNSPAPLQASRAAGSTAGGLDQFIFGNQGGPVAFN